MRNSLICVYFARIVGRTRPSGVMMPMTSRSRSARPSGSGTFFARLCGSMGAASSTARRPIRFFPIFVVKRSISSAAVVRWIPANRRANSSSSGAEALLSAKFLVMSWRWSKYEN